MPISMLFWPNWTRKYSNTCTLLQLFSVYGAIKGNQTSIFSFQKYISYFRTSNKNFSQKILHNQMCSHTI
jgi:hypothetical protein